MSTLDVTRAELALIVLYLNKAESRDKICRAIQYGSKFLSNGQPGTAQNVDKQAWQEKSFVSSRLGLFLDQVVWLGRSGIYKDKERTELIGRISLFCWMGSSVCSTLVELRELGRLSTSMKKLEKELKGSDKHRNEQYRAKVQKYNDRSLALVRAAMDIVVAAGLLQLAPKKITPRVTGAFGFVTSLMRVISCFLHDRSPRHLVYGEK